MNSHFQLPLWPVIVTLTMKLQWCCYPYHHILYHWSLSTSIHKQGVIKMILNYPVTSSQVFQGLNFWKRFKWLKSFSKSVGVQTFSSSLQLCLEKMNITNRSFYKWEEITCSSNEMSCWKNINNLKLSYFCPLKIIGSSLALNNYFLPPKKHKFVL